ncbi:DUF2889 domain-containing protein [Hydrogenophaga sp. BPS33]|uniref:DUF2889 domain-containing protein n=1 Tax=Hydrogenophaga sp. BPS33 TaxID=2651974 RepID=UPI0013202B4A|nr:DUF2889 domain-containing protein [Hydrogenophaga sp. BPS33]QHE84585.1 DUF2889 domain-containing protein [Hydrogenophaga sp. BPS33]
MPLSPPQTRSPITARHIVCEGFRRDDGLWEVEARLADTRSYEAPTLWRPNLPAGEPFHEMALRLAFDDLREIHEIEVAIDSHPFPECPSAIPNFQRLIGLRMGAGFNKAVQARVGGEEGCTHVLTLITNMATVAVQTLGSQIRWNDRASAERVYGLDADGKPPVVGACRGYGRSGEMVRRIYPDFYIPK